MRNGISFLLIGNEEVTFAPYRFDNLRTFAQDYAKRLENFDGIDPQTRFGELFAEREDGSTRLRDFFFEKSDITGVIGKYVNFDAELRRRLVIGYDLLAQYGPAWRQRFVNLYITTPEHGILIYWPGKPWGLNANSWEVNAKLALNENENDEVLAVSYTHRSWAWKWVLTIISANPSIPASCWPASKACCGGCRGRRRLNACLLYTSRCV